jgi:hypothetical protein
MPETTLLITDNAGLRGINIPQFRTTIVEQPDQIDSAVAEAFKALAVGETVMIQAEMGRMGLIITARDIVDKIPFGPIDETIGCDSMKRVIILTDGFEMHPTGLGEDFEHRFLDLYNPREA